MVYSSCTKHGCRGCLFTGRSGKDSSSIFVLYYLNRGLLDFNPLLYEQASPALSFQYLASTHGRVLGMILIFESARLAAHWEWEVGNSLDAFRLAVITSYLLWMACMAILARASILHTNLWSLFGAASLFVALPLMLWGVGTDLQLLRGCPAVEAMIISFVNIFLSVLPMGGIIVQHALFLSVASMELWTSARCQTWQA
eukprot:1153662-Pelagomonas_calceolata.AAC.2